ncbi:MAG: PAS domain S-box protein, partial [Candidatus Heimdallarchaeota archaeon]|nr:PAS domain S-box protein [Candidatus Heimdallarchaeota archaeon]MCK4877194.1 PAS domain S-box protein [Candidatus Heimdallarchaeota archaeon]
MLEEAMGGLLDKANIGITFLIDNKIKFVNEKFLQLTDYSEEEIIEKSFIFLSTNEEKERLSKIEIELSEQKIHPKIIEFWIETKNGVRKYIRNHYYASKDKKKKEGFLVLSHDLTKEKSKEVKVLASEFKKSRFLDFLSEQIIFYDTDLRIIWTNKAASDSIGEIPESMVGEICYELWYQVDAPCTNCPVIKAKDTRQEHSAEVITPDGKIWDVRGYPVFGDDGVLIGMAELASDITESKQKLKDLAKSEERFKQIFHNTNDGIFVVKRETDGKFIEIIEANEIASRMYGYTLEEFLEMKPSDFNITGDEETPEFIKNLVEEKRLTVERNHRTKEGELMLVEISAHLFTLGEDTVSLAIIRDITEKKKADEELIENEEKFRQIFQNSSDAIFIHSLSSDRKLGKFIEVNDIGCEWTGYTRKELLEISPPELGFDEVAHDEGIGKELQTKGNITFEGYIQNREGYVRNVEYNSNIFELKGEKVILTTARDITERLIAQQEISESEERFRKLFETIPDALIAADLNGDITYANHQAAKLYGVENINQLMNENSFQFIAQEDLMRAQNGFKAILTSGYVRNKQFHIVNKDGSRTPVETNASVILDSEGNPSGFIAIVRDISKKLQAEKSIQDSEEKFRQIFHSGNDAIFIHKLTRDGKLGNFIEVNNVAS